MKFFIRQVLVLFFTAIFYNSIGQVIDANTRDSASHYSITPYSSYLQTTKLISIDSVIHSQSGFIKARNEHVLIFNYDPYYYWYRFIVKNTSDTSLSLMLVMAPTGMYEGKLYQKNNAQWSQVAHSGLKFGFRDRSYQFNHYTFPFNMLKNSTDTLYLSINASNAYKSFGFSLLSPKELKVFENKIYFVFGIIVGLLILFFVINIFLFFVLKQKLHLWYALYIALLFLVVMKNDQLDQEFLGLDSEMAFRLTPFLAIGSLAISVLMHVVQVFVKGVLIKNRFLYRLSLFLKINVIISALVHSVVFFAVHNVPIQSIVFSWAKISTLLGICMIITNCLYAVSKGFNNALFLLSGSLVFLIGSVQRLFFPSTLSFMFPPTTFHIGIILEVFIISFGLSYRYYWENEDKKKKETDFNKLLLKAQLEIQEQTLNQISQEIHDNIGQTLSLVKLNLSALPAIQEKIAEEKILSSKDLVGKAIQDLRNLSKKLNSDSILSDGILSAIKYELDIVGRTAGVTTDFVLSGTPVLLDPEKELILFRLLQEALNNIIKHSQASTIIVRVNFMEKIFEMSIEDNGHGFEFNPADDKKSSGGIGLLNMRSRSQLIGGSFEIESKDGIGTKIIVVVPITQF